MDKEMLYTTGELADMAGITYKSIRIYVDKGLLSPDKTLSYGKNWDKMLDENF